MNPEEQEETASDEERRQNIRREYNRRNAQRSRQRTKERIEGLITEVETLERREVSLVEHQTRLQAEVQRLLRENEILRVSAGLPAREAENAEESDRLSLGFDQTLYRSRAAYVCPPATSGSEVDQALILSLLRAEQGTPNVASVAASSAGSLAAVRASLLRDEGLSSFVSAESVLPYSSLLGGLSGNLASRQGQALLHLPRAAYAENMQRQHLLSGLGGPTVSGSIEDRLRELQVLAILRDHNAAASPEARSVPTVDGANSAETARLLEFLLQRASDSQARGALLGQSSGPPNRGSSSGPQGSI